MYGHVKSVVLYDNFTDKYVVAQYSVDDNQPRIDIRWHEQDDEGDLIPTAEGINLPLDLAHQVIKTYPFLEDGESIIFDEGVKEPVVVQHTVCRGFHDFVINHYDGTLPSQLKPGRRGISLPNRCCFGLRVMWEIESLINYVS